MHRYLVTAKVFSRRCLALCTLLLFTVFPTLCCAADTIDSLKAAREAYINNYRIHGQQDANQARDLEYRLRSLEKKSKGSLRAQALCELATIQRMTNQFETAIATYKLAAEAARESRDSATGFDAWLGTARSHAYGTRNHGAAAAAFERAVAAAGANPTKKQRYEMADYSAQLQTGRGELDSALLNAFEAVKRAQDDSQRLYAYLDSGDVLQKYAESCDYRKLVDARTFDENDPWGACRRAVAAAGSYYEKARGTAHTLGWRFLEQEAQGFQKRLATRLFLINQKASSDNFGQSGVFNARNVSSVLVNESFSSGASEIGSAFPFASLIDEVAPESKAADPRSIYLRGLKADLDGNPALALKHFKTAADLLNIERASLFDLRQSGTVVENRTELILNLGLRLLKFKKLDEAFTVFESLRARGLEMLTTAFEKNRFSDAERKWIAGLIQLDSQISAKQNGLVETAIAGIEQSRSLELLDELHQLQQQRRERQGAQQFQSVVQRFTATKLEIPKMSQLKASVDRSGIPVVLYWVMPTNFVVWVVSPKGISVKTVFLPEAVVADKVNKLRNSLTSSGQAFDTTSAKELHTYLIKPFAQFLTQKQVVIIAQGALVGLPFEALIDAEDNRFMAEKVSVSYAPNAAFALRALKGSQPDTSRIAAFYDEKLESETHEIRKISDIRGILVKQHPSKGMDSGNMIKQLGSARTVHVLLHGEYNYDDPLLSTLKIREGGASKGAYITAAQLLAVDWRTTHLAVFSSCEGALVKTRISNEQFGISWALLAGGADQVLLSRWRVNAASNAAWMETFYRSLAVERRSPAVAANAAMRRMIESDKRHPYYWAGPQLFGI
jgi:CHAT domain-containing protein